MSRDRTVLEILQYQVTKYGLYEAEGNQYSLFPYTQGAQVYAYDDWERPPKYIFGVVTKRSVDQNGLELFTIADKTGTIEHGRELIKIWDMVQVQLGAELLFRMRELARDDILDSLVPSAFGMYSGISVTTLTEIEESILSGSVFALQTLINFFDNWDNQSLDLELLVALDIGQIVSRIGWYSLSEFGYDYTNQMSEFKWIHDVLDPDGRYTGLTGLDLSFAVQEDLKRQNWGTFETYAALKLSLNKVTPAENVIHNISRLFVDTFPYAGTDLNIIDNIYSPDLGWMYKISRGGDNVWLSEWIGTRSWMEVPSFIGSEGMRVRIIYPDFAVQSKTFYYYHSMSFAKPFQIAILHDSEENSCRVYQMMYREYFVSGVLLQTGISRVGQFVVGEYYEHADNTIWMCTEIYKYVDPNPMSDIVFWEHRITLLQPKSSKVLEFTRKEAEIYFRPLLTNVKKPYKIGDIVSMQEPRSFDQAVISNVYEITDNHAFTKHIFYSVQSNDKTYWFPHPMLKWVRFDKAATVKTQHSKFISFQDAMAKSGQYADPDGKWSTWTLGDPDWVDEPDKPAVSDVDFSGFEIGDTIEFDADIGDFTDYEIIAMDTHGDPPKGFLTFQSVDEGESFQFELELIKRLLAQGTIFLKSEMDVPRVATIKITDIETVDPEKTVKPVKSDIVEQHQILAEVGQKQYPLEDYLHEKTDLINRNITLAGVATIMILGINIILD